MFLYIFEALVNMLQLLIWMGGLVRNIKILGLSYLEVMGALLSVICICYFTPKILDSIYTIWVAPALKRYKKLREMGQWAVVTGASDGIGKAYAQEIARQGVNIVLISRTKSKLQEVADEIERDFGVDTKIIAIDFTEGLHVYDKIEKELEGLEIGTLVNNVGMWYPYLDYYLDIPHARKHTQDMIFCNIIPVTFLTHAILPQMCSRQRGVIINIGSYIGVGPVPLNSMYSATKIFTERFTESLALEYEKQGVTIQAVVPQYVSTRMSGVSTPSWATPSPTDYVQKALKTVGIEIRTSVHIPHRLSILANECYFFFERTFTSRCHLRFFLTLRDKSKRRREMKNKIKNG